MSVSPSPSRRNVAWMISKSLNSKFHLANALQFLLPFECGTAKCCGKSIESHIERGGYRKGHKFQNRFGWKSCIIHDNWYVVDVWCCCCFIGSFCFCNILLAVVWLWNGGPMNCGPTQTKKEIAIFFYLSFELHWGERAKTALCF